MKYIPPYRIETGGIYEYSEEQQAYVHIYRKSQLSKEELAKIQRELWAYERRYDAWKKKQQ